LSEKHDIRMGNLIQNRKKIKKRGRKKKKQRCQLPV
jgi:hypothetical protein